ncbi:TPA: Tn3 family transposase, partial [Klebsiella pneumoniae]|nr:Tn3 family transposase [Klebsiella pneumoniae]MCB3064139.1 Tn3 family transposase [Klebsiella pneumoniae]HBT1585268.1 Tn3 family transposase [Klebsiella pneumoniae]HBT5407632.1 Tn3 family transposase [Klebsiella pneumoniae]
LKHYTLSDEDLGHIRLRRRAHNRFGFALQLCVLRYPGRVLAPGELIPAEVIEFIGAQLGLGADDLVDYAAREETRHEHLAELRGLYGFRTFSGRGASELKEWLFREAEMAVSNEDIARRFVAECRRTRTVLPATSTIERLCAAALVDAERRIETRIASRLPMSIREQLLALLEETADDRVTRFVWLRQFEPGSNSSSANRLLDRLEYLQRIDLPEDLLAGVPAHRVTRLRRQGERYYADGMRDLPEDRRLAILAVCVSEWQAMLADAVVETHDRIVGRLYRASERICHAKVADEAGVVRDTLKSFAEIGGALVDAQDDGQPLGDVIASGSGWDGLKTLVAMATRLTATMADDPLNHVLDGYHRFRRYAPRMLRLLDLRAAPVALPLLEAVTALRTGLNDAAMTSFLRPSSKWHRHLRAQRAGDARLWEIAVLFHLRDAFRSGDVWLTRSRRYGDLKHALVPAQSIAEGGRLAVPLRPEEWLADRQARLDMRLRELGRAARAGTIPGGFTDHVFAACAILGYRFAPRIRDLPSKRLYAFNPSAAPAHLRALIGGKVNQAMIERNWPDILRIAATIAAGTVAPSQILRKLASYPRQNELATALREVGRVERTLFMIDWILDAELQRRAQIGLNKGEAHHALKRAISFHRRGEIRDRSAEGQHYRIAGMNLLAAIIIFWNTMKLGEVVANQKRDGKLLSPDLLAHVSPLGWEHINLTGEYRWPKP